MSEFKFACPVCGQHMMCDESQAGSVMDCPTCFQKIVAPQAPGPDSKFILTGTKLSEKKISVRGMDAPAAEPEKSFPLWIFIVFATVVVAGAAGFFIYRAKHTPPPKPPEVVKAPVKAPPKPAPVAPHASDTNWTMTLDDAVLVDAPVAGRIHGQDFLIERATFSAEGTLTLRAGQKGSLEFGAQINFGGAPADALSGKSINVTAAADKAAAVTLAWKDADGVQKAEYDVGYAMRLEFGALANNKLPGKIYLCLPDKEKSYLAGSFRANVSKPKPPKQ